MRGPGAARRAPRDGGGRQDRSQARLAKGTVPRESNGRDGLRGSLRAPALTSGSFGGAVGAPCLQLRFSGPTAVYHAGRARLIARKTAVLVDCAKKRGLIGVSVSV